jgi:hypothetical protein
MKKLTVSVVASAVLGALVLAGCNQSESSSPTAGSAAATPLPAGVVSDQPIAGAQDLSAVKATAKDGDTVVLTGWVGGADKPIADNRALLTLADKSLPKCSDTPMDDCKTPWDSCCETPEHRAAKTATVQVVDDKGKPLSATFASVAGLKPLSQVTVSGVARRPAGGDSLVIEAKSIHVDPPTPTTKPAK